MIKRVMGMVMLLSSVVAQGADMNPGLWQWNATMEMPGMPMAMPPTSFSECITEADLVPQQQQQQQGEQYCDVVEQKVSRGQVSWTVKCSGPDGDSTSRGELQYSGDSAHGTIVMDNMGMRITTRMEGKRLGPCR